MEVVQSASESKQAAPRFETIRIGDTIPARSYGELTIIDAVRWAGFQENYAQLHYDREYVRREGNLKTFIASGAYRESLMVRLLTDWMGPKGRLCKLATRQMNPTFEGDSMTFSGEVVEKISRRCRAMGGTGNERREPGRPADFGSPVHSPA